MRLNIVFRDITYMAVFVADFDFVAKLSDDRYRPADLDNAAHECAIRKRSSPHYIDIIASRHDPGLYGWLAAVSLRLGSCGGGLIRDFGIPGGSGELGGGVNRTIPGCCGSGCRPEPG
jgi:hypothetical protein